MTLLSVQGLSVAIHSTPILSGVSFDMTQGQVFGLVGESGSGKSMTALALMGLLPRGAVAAGSARFQGQDLFALPEAALCRLRGRDIGMIFQEPMTALNPVMTIGNQVAETLRIHTGLSRREARAAARERLDRVGLPADRISLDRYPHELSGGQRQRVAIAMAVALRPALLIADEPTTALDVTTQAQILDLLGGLVDEQGMALLLITHDLAVVAERTDSVAVMRQGRIVEQGATEAVFRTRAQDYTRHLFAAASHIPPRAAPPRDKPLLTVDRAVRDYRLPRPRPFGPLPIVRAVDHVSLTIARGESVGLVGESGCGKSTLTRAILGLDPLQGGKIRLDGHTVGPNMPRAVRAGMQMVFQDPYGSFDPRWTVGRLVAEPFHLTGQPPDAQDRVAEALSEVGLTPEDAGKYIHEFSGGQRQRIAIARALITRPRLLVLDEPVSALDLRVRAQILDLLAGLQQDHGLSYLFISHDLSVVRQVTDRVLIMQAGRIVEEGPTGRVFAAPVHDQTRRLVAATPRIPSEMAPSRRLTRAPT